MQYTITVGTTLTGTKGVVNVGSDLATDCVYSGMSLQLNGYATVPVDGTALVVTNPSGKVSDPLVSGTMSGGSVTLS